MNAIPAVRAARRGLSGRRVQTIVIGLVVLVSTAASTLALGLLVASNAPFDRAFAAQRGADVTAAINTSSASSASSASASSARLAATTRLPGVTATAGPFAETTVTALVPIPGGGPRPGPSGGPSPGQQASLQAQVNLVGRSSPNATVDDLTLDLGSLGAGPGTGRSGMTARTVSTCRSAPSSR